MHRFMTIRIILYDLSLLNQSLVVYKKKASSVFKNHEEIIPNCCWREPLRSTLFPI